MSNTSEWSVSAGSNNASPPNGWPEGMQRSAVNDCAREMMAALAKWYQDARGSLTLGGGTLAYTLTTNNAHAALNDIPAMVVLVNSTCTGACTLAVDGLAAKGLVKSNGDALVAGDIEGGDAILIAYNGTADKFYLLSPINNAASILAALLTVDGAGSGLDADLLDGASSAAFARVANNLTDMADAATAFYNIAQFANEVDAGIVEFAGDEGTFDEISGEAVQPVHMKQHKGVIKAWAAVNTGGDITVGYGLTSNSGAPGTGTVLSYDGFVLADSVNAVVACVSSNDGAQGTASVTAQSASSFTVRTTNTSGTNTDRAFTVVVLGMFA